MFAPNNKNKTATVPATNNKNKTATVPAPNNKNKSATVPAPNNKNKSATVPAPNSKNKTATVPATKHKVCEQTLCALESLGGKAAGRTAGKAGWIWKFQANNKNKNPRCISQPVPTRSAFSIAIAVAALALIVLFSGCLSNVAEKDKFNAVPVSPPGQGGQTGGSDTGGQGGSDTNNQGGGGGTGEFDLGRFLDPTSTYGRGLQTPTPCTCMYCTNRSLSGFPSIWASIKRLFGSEDLETTLAYGNCTLSACNATTFAQVLDDKSPDLFPRFFMLGQGPNAGEYSLAQRYCNGSLTMPVIWAVGNATKPPLALSRSLAACYLTRNQMPIVVVRNNNPSLPLQAKVWENISKSYNGNGQPASVDGPVGPVIITTEALSNYSDPDVRARVLEQIRAIKSNCKSCLVALAPDDLNYDALDFFLNSTKNPQASDISLVGVGFIANADPNITSCTPDSPLGKHLDYSFYSLNRYHTPSVWYAVGFANGSTATQGCSFTNLDVRNAYEWIAVHIPELAQTGIIGAAPYRFLDSNNSLPIPCDPSLYSCDFGLRDLGGNQKRPSFFGWFSACQYYTTETTSSGITPRAPSIQQAIVFSTNGEGNACTIADTTKMAAYGALRTVSEDNIPAIPEPDAKLQQRVSGLSCGMCLASTPMPKNFCYRSSSFSKPWCDKEQQLDEAVLLQGGSPYFMRAIFGKESGIGRCKIAPNETNPSSCYDPQGKSLQKLLDANANGGWCDAGEITRRYNEITDAGDYVCAIGVSQCIDSPGKDPSGQNGICNGQNYNPFNPYDSACCGTYKFLKGYNLQKIIDAKSQYQALKDQIKDGEEEWYAAWISLSAYRGNGPKMSDLISYGSSDYSKDSEKNLVKYIDAKYANSKNKLDQNVKYYSTGIISAYNDGIQTCGWGCEYQGCSSTQTA